MTSNPVVHTAAYYKEARRVSLLGTTSYCARLIIYCLDTPRYSPLHIFEATHKLHSLYFSLYQTGLPRMRPPLHTTINLALFRYLYDLALATPTHPYTAISIADCLLGILTLASQDYQTAVLQRLKDYAIYKQRVSGGLSPTESSTALNPPA